VNAPCNMRARKPYAGNPHVRFEEGEGFTTNPLYSTVSFLCLSWGYAALRPL
jgi:hypothetical protein